MNRNHVRLASLVVAVALAAAACGKGKASPAATTSTTASAKDVAAATAAFHATGVQLRTRLTNLLETSSFLTSAVAAIKAAPGPTAVWSTSGLRRLPP